MNLPSPAANSISRARTFIFTHGRLLERMLFEFTFGNGTAESCLRVLRAYQNSDGGFGNGIEPDLLCPESSAIGAETALGVLDLMGCHPDEIVSPLVDWVASRQNQAGFIDHPPANYSDYPYQPWWKNPDRERILSLAGLLMKWGVDCPALYGKARAFYLGLAIPAELEFYDYPYLIYLKYCSVDEEDRSRLAKIRADLPALLVRYRDHCPLLTKGWVEAADLVAGEILEQDAAYFLSTLQPDGGVISAYPQFPGWRPIFTLDGFILLKKWGVLR